MAKFVVKATSTSLLLSEESDRGVLAEVELQKGPHEGGVGVLYQGDDGRVFPLVWVDNFYSRLCTETEDPLGDATVYLHLGRENPVRVEHWSIPDEEGEEWADDED